MEYTLITGASGGIGKELARVFARNHHDLVLVARNAQALDELKTELESTCGVSVICISQDLTAENAVQALFQELQKENVNVSILVNNAGFGDHSAFLDSDWKRQENMVRLNILSLMEMTHTFGNEMKKHGQGRILNLSSVAAFSAGPYMSIYYASKAFVLSFSEAVAKELEGTGVSVTALCPGPTSTGFEQAANMGNSKMFSLLPQTPEDVALAGYKACMQRKAIRYHSPVTYGYNLLSRLLPRKFLCNLAGKVNGKGDPRNIP